MYSIRQGNLTDISQLSELFQETVLSVNRKDYTEAEVADWASCGKDAERWKELFLRFRFFVAEDKDKNIIGFTSISDTGFLHSMFVHKDHQRQGIADALLKHATQYAQEQGAWFLEAEVSQTARPFFEKNGFFVIARQQRKARNLYLTNWRMKKHLPLHHGIGVASPEDLEKIWLLQKRSFTPVARLLCDNQIPPLTESFPDFTQSVAGKLLLKYTISGKIVGSVRAYIDENNYCQIGKLITDPDYQQQGIGKSLMAAVEAYFNRCKGYALFTGTITPHTAALYSKLGYRETGRNSIDGIEMIFMEKSI